MMIEHSKQIEKDKKFFLKMSQKKFDKYMCKTYPEFFSERNLPMTQTCMCWGFDVGPGWYWILDRLCKNLMVIKKASGVNVVFTQIKEKFAGGRFYHGSWPKRKSKKWNDNEYSIWGKIIDNEVSIAEELCEYTCSKCAEYKHDVFYIGRWAHDTCEKCLLELNPDLKNELGRWKIRKDIKNNEAIWLANDKELESLNILLESITNRSKKEYEDSIKKLQEEYKKKDTKNA